MSVPLRLPAASCALSENVCFPLLRGPGYDTGLVHTANVELSSWQRNVTPVSESVKLKVALLCVVVLAGAEVITGLGGAVVSMVQEKLAGEL